MSNTNESTTDEIGLYVVVFIVLFCMVLSFLTFLKFEGENIKKERVSFTLSSIFSSISIKLCGFFSFMKKTLFLVRKKFTKKAIKKIAPTTPFLNPLTAIFRRLKSIPQKIIHYEWKLPVHWDFGTLVLSAVFLFIFVLYGDFFEVLQYKDDLSLKSLLFLVLTFLYLAIFSLQYGYEIRKYVFYVFVFLNFVTICFLSFFTSDLFSRFSDVSPEKVTSLLYVMGMVVYVFCFYFLFHMVYILFFLCMIFWSGYFFLYLKFDLFIENPRPNIIRKFFDDDWLLVLLLLACLIFSLNFFSKILGSPTYRFEQIMAEYMFTENNGRCGSLEHEDKIYFYEVDRVLKYVPKDVDKEQYRMKYIDVKCDEKENEKTEPSSAQSVKEKAALSSS